MTKAPVDAKSYRTPGAAKALPKTMKTVKKVSEGKKVIKVTKKPAKKTAPKPSAGAKKAAAAKAPKPSTAKKAEK